MTRSAVVAPVQGISPLARASRVRTGRVYRGFRIRAAAEPAPVEVSEVSEALGKLQDAVIESKFDPITISDAFKSIEKEKAKFEDLGDIVGGGPDGKYWQLQFVSDKKHMKKGGRGGGYRFPLTGIQHFDNGRIENGVYLGHVAYLKFIGNYEIKGSVLAFVFEKLQVKLGPATFTFPTGSKFSSEARFVFFYADEDFIVARGQGGGTAFWKRATPSDLLRVGAA